MKYAIGIIILILVLVGIKKLKAAQVAQNSCFENIGNDEFKEKMTDAKNVVILDVRTKGEFDGGNIKNSKNIDVMSASYKQKVASLDKDKTYLVYCRSGSRSLKAASVLCDLGFTKVYNLSNGYMGWK